KQTLPPLTMPLPNGYELMLRGRIDRVDKALNTESLFLRIIDYKSSENGLNLVEVYYGLALQMRAYLDVVLTHSEQWLGANVSPAAVLYSRGHNPMSSGSQRMADSAIDKVIFKNYKMNGLRLSDDQVVKMMDASLESGRS